MSYVIQWHVYFLDLQCMSITIYIHYYYYYHHQVKRETVLWLSKIQQYYKCTAWRR